MTAVEKIQQSAEALSARERDQLIDSLIAAREEEQLEKIGRRIDEINSGQVEGISSAELFAKAEAHLNAPG